MSALVDAALARAREGALLLPLWWTDNLGICQCPKRADCPSPGKHPLTKSGLDDATSDADTIKGWWRRWPSANLGERTDSVARIDIDLEDVAAELAKDTALPLTTELTQTPRIGLHIATAAPGPIQSRTLYLQDGRKLGELKAARAYVLTPPSVIGSRPYVRLSPDGITPIQVDDPVGWLARLLPAFGFALASEQPAGRRAYEALSGVIYEGQGRHNALVSYAGRIWIDGMAPEALVGALQAVNAAQCRPPLPDDELRAIAEHFVAQRERSVPAGPDHHHPAIVSASGLPQVVVSNRQMREIVDDAWKVLLDHNDPPRFFQHAGAIAEIRTDDDGRPQIVHLGLPGIKGRLDRCANWLRLTDHGPRPARPPRDVVEDMLAIPRALPVLRGITGTPSFAPDGSLIVAPGYQTTTQLYYHPVGEPVPAVPQRPDATDLKRARQVIGQELLGDFPFADDASRTNAIAAVLTAIVRDLIDGPTPLFVIDAPAPGTGKSLLATGTGVIVTGTAPAVMTEPRSEEELRKRVTAVLCAGTSVAVFDNVKHRLASATLSALLTTSRWTDRILGRTQTVELPVRTVWLATGNNVELDNEIARRSVWVRLDARIDRPWQRTHFRHGDLLVWLRRHRHELVWAFLGIVQHWFAIGRPAWDGSPLGSYEAWSSVIGGILQAADIRGFLENREELYRRADGETEEWRSFTRWWWETYGDSSVRSADLLSVAQELLPSVFEKAKDSASEQALRTRLGKALGQRRDRRFGDFFLRNDGEHGHLKSQCWRLEPARDPVFPAEVGGGNSQTSAQPPHDNWSTPDSIAEDAEVAEVVSGVSTDLFSGGVEEERHVRGAIPPTHPPQPPQTDSKSADLGAEDARRIAPDDADVPRCRRCGRRMSVVRVSELCGWCQKS